MSKETLEYAKLWIDDYRNAVDYSIQEEIKMWEYLSAHYQSVSKDKVDIDRQINKLMQEQDKEAFEHKKKLYSEDLTILKETLNLGLTDYQNFIYEYMRLTSSYYGDTSEEYEKASNDLLKISRERYDKDRQLLLWAIEDGTRRVMTNFLDILNRTDPT